MAATATQTIRLADPPPAAARTSVDHVTVGPAARLAGAPRPGDAIRRLAADVAPATSAARLRLPLAMADVAAVLWTTLLKFDAADPGWPDRDRFVLSDRQGSLLPQALLHLTSHTGVGGALHGAAAAPNVQQAAAAAPATLPDPPDHDTRHILNGPHGQGLATAIGMALAERMLAARFGRSLVDHRTWVCASACDLAIGLSHEAICLAGELRLGRLAVLYDAGEASLADVAKRFHAAGWAVRDIDGHDQAAIAGALSFAVRSRRPSLIFCRTDDPGRPGSRAAPGANAMLSDHSGRDDGVAAGWRAAGQRGAAPRRAWLKRLAQHPQRAEFERALASRRPDEWRDALAASRLNGAGGGSTSGTVGLGTRHASRRALDALMDTIPELLSCTAGSARPSAEATALRPPAGHDAYRTRHLPFGPREQGMAAVLNGLALHGGWLPIGRSRGGDGLRPALRLAAMLGHQVIHVLTQDSHADHPAEQLASLRALAKVQVFRPADAVETHECWELALRCTDGPSVIFVSDQPLPPLARVGPDNQAARGAYILAEAAERRAATLIATGPEVGVALQAQARLAADGLPVAVVSMPCWDLFAAQDDAYRASVLGTAPRVGIEAACGFGWERWLGSNGRFIGTQDGSPGDMTTALPHHSDITPDAVIDVVRTLAYRA